MIERTTFLVAVIAISFCTGIDHVPPIYLFVPIFLVLAYEIKEDVLFYGWTEAGLSIFAGLMILLTAYIVYYWALRGEYPLFDLSETSIWSEPRKPQNLL